MILIYVVVKEDSWEGLVYGDGGEDVAARVVVAAWGCLRTTERQDLLSPSFRLPLTLDQTFFFALSQSRLAKPFPPKTTPQKTPQLSA